MSQTTGTVRHTFENVPFLSCILPRVDVEADYKATPYDPGNNYGPAENCYPPEGGEVEDVKFTVLAVVDESGAEWSEALLKEHAEALGHAVMGFYLTFPESLDEKCGQDAMERHYEPDQTDYL